MSSIIDAIWDDTDAYDREQRNAAEAAKAQAEREKAGIVKTLDDAIQFVKKTPLAAEDAIVLCDLAVACMAAEQHCITARLASPKSTGWETADEIAARSDKYVAQDEFITAVAAVARKRRKQNG